MRNTDLSAMPAVSFDTTGQSDSPPESIDKSVIDAQGHPLRCVESPSVHLSSQMPGPSQAVQPETTEARKREVFVAECCENQLPTPDAIANQSQQQEVFVQVYSAKYKTMISVPNPAHDPEGYELGTSAFIRTNDELVEALGSRESSYIKCRGKIDEQGDKIRCRKISDYRCHVKEKGYQTIGKPT